jgi:hypothetical protein
MGLLNDPKRAALGTLVLVLGFSKCYKADHVTCNVRQALAATRVGMTLPYYRITEPVGFFFQHRQAGDIGQPVSLRGPY